MMSDAAQTKFPLMTNWKLQWRRLLWSQPSRTKSSAMREKHRGFTFIELLVVVAIIAILAALLLPALNRAKTSAKSAVCKSNLRQLGIGFRLYVDEFGKYPLMGLSYVTADDNRIRELDWDEAFLAPYCGGSNNVFRCPASKHYTFGDYGYNHKGGSGLGLGGEWVYSSETEDGHIVPTAESRVLVPSDMIAIGDGNVSLAPYAPTNFLWGTMDYWGIDPNHSQGANVVFCDGHVEYGKIRDWVKPDDAHRRRWYNDNQPHPETWAENTRP